MTLPPLPGVFVGYAALNTRQYPLGQGLSWLSKLQGRMPEYCRAFWAFWKGANPEGTSGPLCDCRNFRQVKKAGATTDVVIFVPFENASLRRWHSHKKRIHQFDNILHAKFPAATATARFDNSHPSITYDHFCGTRGLGGGAYLSCLGVWFSTGRHQAFSHRQPPQSYFRMVLVIWRMEINIFCTKTIFLLT